MIYKEKDKDIIEELSNILRNKYVDLFFPRRCPICNEILDFNKEIYHKECLKFLKLIDQPYCRICGKQLESLSSNTICNDCLKGRFFDNGRSLFYYNDYAIKSLNNYKNNNKREFIDFYSVYMAINFINLIKQWNVNCLIPVPSNIKRIKERGFDHINLFANKFVKCLKYLGLNIVINNNLIYSQKYTKYQKGLGYKDRIKNIKGAFNINNIQTDKRVLILDDVFVSGSTINEISKVLKCNNFEKVYFLTIFSK